MRKIVFTAAVLILARSSFAQVSISGPVCVTPGLAYQYIISGNIDSGSSLQVCITGGMIADSSGTCKNVSGFSTVNMIWNQDANNGSISVSSSAGNASLNVSITTTLQGGAIDSSILFQTINYDTIPADITCSTASQGSCSPSYNYQWQQSADQVSWIDIPGSTNQQLSIVAALINTTFYRRKVVEIVSGSIAYSNVASVFVNPAPPGN